MTKKDYERIAAALARRQPSPAYSGARLNWTLTVQEMADALAADNPRFDRARFYRACGYSA